MRTNALVSLWLVFVSFNVLAATQEETEALYRKAIAAIKNNDCASGAVLLRKYKVDAAELLKSKPNFSAGIDKQIADCEAKVAAGASPKPWALKYQGVIAK